MTGSSSFQSLEMEAESELLEIQTMLSMFDDIPAATSSAKDEPQSTTSTSTCPSRTVSNVQSQGHSSDGEQSIKQTLVTDKVLSRNHCSRHTADGDDVDIESILQEMNTIDGKGIAVTGVYVCVGTYDISINGAVEHRIYYHNFDPQINVLLKTSKF